jgi:uncharacterized protein YjlB
MKSNGPQPKSLLFADDGRIPNSRYPVLIYRGCFSGARGVDAMAGAFEQTFAAHHWLPDWRGGIYDYHHYHSTAHEALGIAGGYALLMLGGEQGERVEIRAGDVLILPAGTGHCALEHSADLLVVGAYPQGQRWDVMRGEPGEREAALLRIAKVPMPLDDPIGGALLSLWQ